MSKKGVQSKKNERKIVKCSKRLRNEKNLEKVGIAIDNDGNHAHGSTDQCCGSDPRLKFRMDGDIRIPSERFRV
jgi:hypothetical protein